MMMSLIWLLKRTELIHTLLDHFRIIDILMSGMLFSCIAYGAFMVFCTALSQMNWLK